MRGAAVARRPRFRHDRRMRTADQPIRISLIAPEGRMGKAIAKAAERLCMPGFVKLAPKVAAQHVVQRHIVIARHAQRNPALDHLLKLDDQILIGAFRFCFGGLKPSENFLDAVDGGKDERDSFA